jgi:xanthine dehydrogenase accessory factor
MEQLYSELVELLAAGQPFSLATVVHTAGSTPQKAGARAIFLPDGRVLGTLGGGCMEAESRRRGLELIQDGKPLFYELHLDDDFGWDDGLICGGTAQIFIQPMRRLDVQPFADAIALRENRGRGVLATVVSAAAPEAVGATLLVRDECEGAPAGAATGAMPPELSAAVVDAARAHLAEGREEPRRVALAGGAPREAWSGVVYLEPILPRPTLLIAGAGHVGAALAHYGARIGFEVVVVDDRPSFANRERLPDADEVLVEGIVGAVRRWPKTPETYVVIVTRGHRNDAVVLRELIGTPVAYIGMIGSRRKVLTIYEEFLAEGLATREQLARVHAPIGLDIGAVSVDEIALSIAAELIMVRRGQTDGHGDRAGGGGVAADGESEGALALRERERHRGGRPLADTLPDRRGAGRRRPPGDCCS